MENICILRNHNYNYDEYILALKKWQERKIEFLFLLLRMGEDCRESGIGWVVELLQRSGVSVTTASMP